MLERCLIVIYGITILVVIYFLVHKLFSVYYTPGVSSLYNSQLIQTLFPNENKIFPTWGSNLFGMYDSPFTFGQSDFWPNSGNGYVPTKEGSPGASPTGIRPTFPIPKSVDVGYWGYTPTYNKNVPLDIYDYTPQGTKYISSVGWWGN